MVKTPHGINNPDPPSEKRRQEEIRSGGLATLPREATAEMLAAAAELPGVFNAAKVWRTMWDAHGNSK